MSDVAVESADGTKLAARRSGAGTPVVLAHGAFGSVDTFMLVEPLLAEHHEVWVYSRRGYPGSGGAEDVSLPRNAEDVWAVVEAAGGDAHVCGWSAGGMVTFLAAQGPSSLRSVTLYEPPLGADAEALQPMLDTLIPMYEQSGAEAVLETFLPMIGEPEEAVQALRSQPEIWQRLQASVPGTLAELQAWLDQFEKDAPDPVPPEVPTLYLYGEETTSPMFPSTDVVSSVMPNATLRTLTGQRHLAPVFDPPGFAQAILEFTSQVDG